MASCKADEVCTLFLQCTHAEQLELLTKLANLICRDFIGRLPDLVVCCILQYLPIKDVISCMRVSHHWYSVIQECQHYWRWICNKRGAPSTLESNQSLINLGLKAERHFAKIKIAFAKGKLRSRYIFTKSNRPLLYEDPYGGIVVSAWDLFTHNSSIYLHDFHSNEIVVDKALSELHRPIVWASGFDSKDCVVFATDSADWGIANYQKKQTQYWTDKKVVTPSQAKFSVCKSCLLIVEIEQQPCVRSPTLSWNVELIQLPLEEDQVRRITTQASIENMNSTESDYVSVQSVALVSCNITGSTCEEHYLLVQLGCGVFTFTCSSELQVMGNVTMCCPSGSVQCLKSLGHYFKVSLDNSLFAFVQLTQLYIWSLKDGGTLQSVIDLKSHYNLLAIGNLYTLLQLSNPIADDDTHCLIVSTLTGVPLCSFKLPVKRDFYAPVDQSWLNSIEAFKHSGNTMIIPCSYGSLLKCFYF